MSALLLSDLLPLARLLERDEPRVLVLVGTGISLGATDAAHVSWLGLLEHGVQHLVETQAFTEKRGLELRASLAAAFSPFDLPAALQHAELVEQTLKTPDAAAFARWLQAAFAPLRASETKSLALDALRDLQRTGALLMTTNYDSLLSDATGLPPVTWEEHDRLFALVRHQQPGILHVHGHWQRPSSVVLGRSSYERILNDRDFQDVFRSLWLERSWLCVGCGDGLGDPNLGGLLHWGTRWRKDSPPDYLLFKAAHDSTREGTHDTGHETAPDVPRSGTSDVAHDIAHDAARNGHPPASANLVRVAYPDFAQLPGILQSLTPEARCFPFVPVDASFALFRDAASSTTVPFPSRQEYLDDAVPKLASDAVIRGRLDLHRWAFVLDVASVGKTTLAVRMATSPEQRDHPTYYLDFARFAPDDASEATAAMRRLSRRASLLILDNVHHRPELARELWDHWRDRPSQQQCQLLLIATRIHRTVTTDPSQDLVFFERHATNPAVDLRPTPDDLRHIAAHLYRRVAGHGARPLPDVPPSAAHAWHRDYGSALGAFCLAVVGHLAAFDRGQWALPVGAASEWVRDRWLDLLDAESRANLLCLSVFGAQELELEVSKDALPHPGRTDPLLRLGLVARTQRGPLGQHHRFHLREPGWGRLILAAQQPPVDEEAILFETAARQPFMALVLTARLRREPGSARLMQLWSYLAASPDQLLASIPELPLSWTANLIHAATYARQPALAQAYWRVAEQSPERLAEQAWTTPLSFVVQFLEAAKRHERNTAPLWEMLERAPDKLLTCAWSSPLGDVASFLDTAKRHQRNVTPLWEALERQPDMLAARAAEAPLQFVASFLDTARRHQRDTRRLWDIIEGTPDQFAERALDTPLHFVASFLDTARRHQRQVIPLWEALEREPDRFAESACASPLGGVAAFLDTAKRHRRNTAPLWDALERRRDWLIDRVWNSGLQFVANFLETAKSQQRHLEPLWEAIERQPDRLIARAWDSPLDTVFTFLDVMKRHERNTAVLWAALEGAPDKLADRLWAMPLHFVASVLDTAKRHQRNTASLWEAIERAPDRLAGRLQDASLGDLASFLETAKRHGRDTAPLWEAIEGAPGRLVERLRDAPFGDVTSFLGAARRHERDTAPLWEGLERVPERLAARASDTPLGELASFLEAAKQHGRDCEALWAPVERVQAWIIARAWDTSLEQIAHFQLTAAGHGRETQALWDALDARPAQLSAMARQTTAAQLGAFCRCAPAATVRIALADFTPDHWDAVPIAEPLHGATWVAYWCEQVGHTGLSSALCTTLLRRASPADFPSSQGMSLSHAAWLLEHTPPASAGLVPAFLDALCTKPWLGWHFTHAPSGALANGLRLLALYQPRAIYRRFTDLSLVIRLQKEMKQFVLLAPEEQSQAIQLLGCAMLCGCFAQPAWFRHVPLDTIAALPVDVLPHRPEATEVESWQLQLWLGLRAVSSVTRQPLPVPRDAIASTLELWRANLVTSSAEPASMTHLLNRRMVDWLQLCTREGVLVPPII